MHWEPQQVDVEALCKFCVSPFSVPLVDTITGDLVPFWSVCLNDDESPNQLYRRLKVGHHLEPILSSKIEVGLSSDILTIRCARQKLDEVTLLASYLGCTLAQFVLDRDQRRRPRCSDDN